MNDRGQAFDADGVRDLLAYIVTRLSGVPHGDTLVVVFLAKGAEADVVVGLQPMSLREASNRLNDLRATATICRASYAMVAVFDDDETIAETVSMAVAMGLRLEKNVRVQVAADRWHELGAGPDGERGTVADLDSSSMAAQAVVAGLPFPLLRAGV